MGAIMFMEKKVRDQIYENLFKEGVMVAEKICKRNAGRLHPDVKNVGNLQVIKACQSLTSRGFLKQQFAWRRVLEGIPPPSARDRVRHHEETGENRRQPAARRRTCRSAHSGILARPKGRVPTSRKGRQCRTGRGRLHLPRRRTRRCSPVICIPVCSINTLEK